MNTEMKFKIVSPLGEEFVEYRNGILYLFASPASSGSPVANNPLEIIALIQLGFIKKDYGREE